MFDQISKINKNFTAFKGFYNTDFLYFNKNKFGLKYVVIYASKQNIITLVFFAYFP